MLDSVKSDMSLTGDSKSQCLVPIDLIVKVPPHSAKTGLHGPRGRDVPGAFQGSWRAMAPPMAAAAPDIALLPATAVKSKPVEPPRKVPPSGLGGQGGGKGKGYGGKGEGKGK